MTDAPSSKPITDYAASPAELRQHAALFWPADLIAKEASASIVPLLLETQDKFISLLDIADAHPAAWKQALQTTSGLSANVFLKHLMVLADVGGEQIKRLRPELSGLFPSGTMTYIWREQSYTYAFQSLLRPKTVDNKSLFIDGRGLLIPRSLDGAMEDVAMLLMHGGAVTGAGLPSPSDEKCSIGSLLGHNDELTRFVKQRYVLVSRITGGATSNALGQLAQSFVRDTLAEALPQWKITRNGTVPGISHNAGKTDMGFDVVAKSPLGKYVAVEVMFQVTTNSVIERKAGQALARAQLLHDAGHKIAYVVDGAGVFERASALSIICQHSDCSVCLTADELQRLVEFLQAVENNA